MRLNEIDSDVDYSLLETELELTESRLVNDPVQKVAKALKAWDFLPVTKSYVHRVKQQLKSSKII